MIQLSVRPGSTWRRIVERLSPSIDRRLLGGFGVGLLAFVVLSIASFISARQLIDRTDWVRHTYEVLARIRTVNSDIIGVQAAVRGFIITGREDYLTPYREALRQQQEDESALRSLTADNPRQQARLTTLEDILRERRGFGQQLLDLQRNGGFAAAAALISAGRGQKIMKKLEAVLGAMDEEERELLTNREAQAHARTMRTFLVLSGGAIIDFGLLLAVLFFLNVEATERREAEAHSRLAAEIVKSTGDAVITITLDGIVTSWNPGAELIFGYTAQEAVGSSMQMYIPPECADDETEFLAQIQLGKRVEHFETVRLRKDGRRASVSVTISPLRDDLGRIAGAAKILCDITESKQAQDALGSSEERFRTMANSIPQLVWVARADGFIHWYNDRWFDYTGTTPEQTEGWGWQSVHNADTLPKMMENWTGAIASGEPFEMEFPLRAADGTFRNFLTRVQPFKDSQGRVTQWFGTNTDIDELKHMAESLRASQARLNSTLAAGSIGTWTWDIGNNLLAADEFTARMFSIEPGEAAKGMPVDVYLRAVVKEDQGGVTEALSRAIHSCGAYDIEYRVLQESGELRWLQAKGRVEGDAAGNALSFHGAVIDITERKRTEGRFRRLVDSNAQGVMFWNTKGEITGANDAFLRIVGYTREDQQAGRIAWAAITPPEYAHLDELSLRELEATGICTPFEKEYIRKDGTRVPILLGAATFEDSRDEGVCFLLDVTERKRTDRALRESEEHFRFLNDLSEAIRMLTDPATIMAVTARMLGQHLRASRCAYADVKDDGGQFTIVHDYTDGCESIVGDYRLSLFGERAVAAAHSGQTLIIHDVEAELLPAEGADMFTAIGIHAIIACPLFKDGVLRAMVAVHQSAPRNWSPGEIKLVEDVVERFWDSIERRVAEENIRRLNAGLEQRVAERTADAEASNRAKSVFLSTISHEIRTPMNAILGYSQLMLRDRNLGTDAQANLRIINRSGEHLLALINDVLDMSRIEAGRLELNPATFSLSGLLKDMAGMFRLRAEAKALRFEVLPDGESGAYIVADEGKMRQVLINLLGNAIKFTESGCIRLHISLSERKVNRPWLSARVEDTGSGISEDEQRDLFQSFSQTKRGINQGTGLGLAISRAYARLMGGDLTVASSRGTGSVFEFGVPIEYGDAKVAIRRGVVRRVLGIRAGQAVPRILVADDLHENRDWLLKLLTAVGFSVRCADDGEAAIREWREWSPRLILMDMHMPVMDGLEATRRIKAAPGGNETSIVILTASVLDEDRRNVRQSGADAFLAKPCREDELLDKVGTLLSISYDCEEVGIGDQPHGPTAGCGAKSPAHVAEVPRELIEELRDATSNGDKQLLNRLIGSVRQTENAEFARDLQSLADQYKYDALTKLLEEACL